MSDLNEELSRALKDTDEVAAPAREASAETLPRAKKKTNLGLLAGLLAVAAGVVTLFLVGFKEAAIYAMPTDEVVAKAETLKGKRLRVDGLLVPGTLKEVKSCEYHFTMQKNDKELPVRYAKCVLPDTFRDRPEGGVEVTVEGELTKGQTSFEANLVMAKCASKYDPATHEGGECARQHEVRPVGCSQADDSPSLRCRRAIVLGRVRLERRPSRSPSGRREPECDDLHVERARGAHR
jgi:cytochrome c-type biogenesis protein CcmE